MFPLSSHLALTSSGRVGHGGREQRCYRWALLASDLRGRASLAGLMPGTHGIDLTGSVFFRSVIFHDLLT